MTRRDANIIRLTDPEIDRRLKAGPELVSANFVIPYPPGFPIMVPGQVITQETIDFMRKLDVKEIHGYDAKEGLKLVRHGSAGEDRQAQARPQHRSSKLRHKRGTNMQGFFTFLQQNPYLLLFFVVGLAVWIGRASIKGYGLGMVAGAIVVGAGLSVWASTYGVKLELNNFAKSLFYYLFMYGVGLRVGPVLHQQPEGRRPQILHPGAGVERAWSCACRHWRKALLAADRRRRRHAGGFANHVGCDRLGRAGHHLGRRQAARGHEARGRHRHDRAVLRHHLHLGYRRHHPDLQIPAALVGRRRQGCGEAVRGGIWRQGSRRRRLSPAIDSSACAPTGWKIRPRSA